MEKQSRSIKKSQKLERSGFEGDYKLGEPSLCSEMSSLSSLISVSAKCGKRDDLWSAGLSAAGSL